MLGTRTVTMADVWRPGATPWIWDGILILSCSLLVSACARISVPLPFTPVPVTGQTFAVLVAGALLGSRRGAAALVLYLVEGVGGLPVFALGHSGWAVIAGPTGGYLLAYPLAAFAVGWLAEHGWDRGFWRAVVAMGLGELVIYAVGLPWLANFVGSSHVAALGLVPFIPGDAVKLLLAAALLPSGWSLLASTRANRF